MSKQVDIREGIAGLINLSISEDTKRTISNAIMLYLHREDVVIKVDEISDDVARTASDGETRTACGRGMVMVSTYKSVDVFRTFKDMGYVAIEPLIDKGER